MTRHVAAALLLAALALSACGGSKNVDVASYTCAQFTKSLNTKGDDSAGNYINQLRKKANLDQPKQTEIQEVSLGIIFTCRGKPATTRPAAGAIEVAKSVKAGKFRLRVPQSSKKKSSK
jgi:hypothetical protein